MPSSPATPPLTAASTVSLDGESTTSTEAFPELKPQLEEVDQPAAQQLTTAHVDAAKEARSKRFSLRALARPFVWAARGHTRTAKTKETEAPRELKSARKQTEDGRESGRVARRVSFSPSTEEANDAREQALSSVVATAVATDYGRVDRGEGKTGRKPGEVRRRASFNDSIGRQGRLHARKRAVSFSWDKQGVHVASAPHPSSHDSDKGRTSRPRVTRQQAIAARHARALEQIIHAGSSIEFDSVEELKAKRERKTAGKHDKTKVQMIPAVSPRKVLALKKALLDSEMANDIIGQLRFMQLEQRSVGTPPGSKVQQGEVEDLLQTVLAETEERERKRTRPMPVKAVCLDCTEEEASRRQRVRKAKPATAGKESVPLLANAEAGAVTTAAAATAAAAWGLGGFFKAKHTTTKTMTVTDSRGEQLTSTTVTSVQTPASEAYRYVCEIHDDVVQGDVGEAMADMTRISVLALKQVQPLVGAVAESVEERVLPPNKELEESAEAAEEEDEKKIQAAAASGILAHVSPISFIVSPGTTAASMGLSRSGAFDALGAISGIVVEAANGGADGMQEIQPPLDRMAIFIHWWGFELTLPRPSMSYLGTAQSVSGSFLTFLQTMVVTGGVPELLPFVRYFSSFVDMEFGAIKSQDRGHGVVIAATWLMPMALVPRPWDYPTTPAAKAPATMPPPNAPATTPPPALPARLSSMSGNQAGSAARRSRSPSPSSISSRERHASASRAPAIASAAGESMSAHQPGSSLLNQAHPVDVLDRLEELPEGSVRVR